MTELEEKTQKAIERLRAFEPPEGYYLAFSGGKDSVVCKALCDMAGVKYDAHYRLTSVDPPELVRFIREEHPDVEIEKPRYSDTYKHEYLRGKQITMWNLIVHRGVPTRLARFCCEMLKESGGDGRMTVTGVRWAESVNRKRNQGEVTVFGRAAAKELDGNEDFQKNSKGGVVLVNDNEDSRRMVEQCYKRHKTTLNPIIDWSDREVWDFIKNNGVKYCKLYDEGFTRLGCIGCPIGRRQGRERDFARYPTYKASYLRAFDKMLNRRKEQGKTWGIKVYGDKVEATPEMVFNWWMEYDILPGQMSFDDMEDDE